MASTGATLTCTGEWGNGESSGSSSWRGGRGRPITRLSSDAQRQAVLLNLVDGPGPLVLMVSEDIKGPRELRGPNCPPAGLPKVRGEGAGAELHPAPLQREVHFALFKNELDDPGRPRQVGFNLR
jgi:hypothetical protein